MHFSTLAIAAAAAASTAYAFPSTHAHGHQAFHKRAAAPAAATAPATLQQRNCPAMTCEPDEDDGSQGIFVTNWANSTKKFYLVPNGCDGTPSRELTVAAGEEVFCKLPKNFQGRMQRGVDSVTGSNMVGATIFEITQDSSSTTPFVFADVSLIKGCDGGLYIEEVLSNSARAAGKSAFTGGMKDDSCLNGAPSDVMATKYTAKDGTPIKTVRGTEDYANAKVLTDVKSWLVKAGINEKTTYLDEALNPCHGAESGRWRTYWTEGRP